MGSRIILEPTDLNSEVSPHVGEILIAVDLDSKLKYKLSNGTITDVGTQGVDGPQGATGSQGYQGYQGATGSQGYQGATGSQGDQGATGSQGDQGATGSSGIDGIDSGVRFIFNNNTDTTVDPGSGYFNLDSTTFSSIGVIGVSNTAYGGVDATGLNSEFYNWFNTNYGRGYIQVSNSYDKTNLGIFEIGSATVPAWSGIEFNVSNILLSSGTASGMTYSITFFKYGTNGITGSTGINGSIGIDGPTGSQGPTGPQGLTGNQGYQGITGASGLGIYTTTQSSPAYFPSKRTGETMINSLGDVYTWTGVFWNYMNYNIKGPQGYQGPQGLTGPIGATFWGGPTGSQGFQGATGPQGFQGTQGFQGYVGPQGLVGADTLNIKVDISALQLATLFSVPVTLIPSPGPGFSIIPNTIVYRYTYGSVVYDFASSLYIYHGTKTPTTENFASIGVADITAGSNKSGLIVRSMANVDAIAENKDIMLAAVTSNPTTGDGTLTIWITYTIITW